MLDMIQVTRSLMPEFEEYLDEISDIWETHWLTNMGVKHRRLQNELKKYKKVSFIIWLVQCCLLVVFFVYKSYQFSTIMLYTHIVIVIAAVAQTMSEIKNR